MLNIPDEVKALFQADSVFKNFHVHFPNGENTDLNNDDIVSESVSFTESICSKEVFQFGLSERSQIEFECVGVQNIYGMTIECAIEIDVASLGAAWISSHQPTGTEEWLDSQVCTYDGRNLYRVPYGRFIVESCPRSQGAMKHRRVNAYSMLDQIVGIDGFLQNVVLSTPETSISIEALYAYLTNDVSDFTRSSVSGGGAFPEGSYLFDASGYAYRFIPETWRMLQFQGVAGYALNYEETGNVSNESIGIAVAQYLDANNYDLTYDPDGVKMFDSNEEALRTMAGFLFSPAVYPLKVGVDYTAAYYMPYPARIGGFSPIVTGAGARFDVLCITKADYINISKSSSVNIWAGSTTWNVLHQLTIDGYTATVNGYEYSNTDIINNLTIKNTGTISGAVSYIGKASSSSNKSKWFRADMYSYVNAYTNRDLVAGYAEIHGAFAHVNRTGTFEIMNISAASPYSIAPSDYSELWWDEYDVESVGTVKYSFTESTTGQNVIGEMDIGAGFSVYEMLNNFILNNIAIDEAAVGVTTRKYIETMLTADFVPALADISFTPVELSAIGLPYLEAGDYLEIDDADGGTVGTYILTRTINGIQVLTDSIESNGGEVLGDVS